MFALLAALAAPLPSAPSGPVPELSAARFEGFLRIWVTPDAFADGLTPIEPSPSASARVDLFAENTSSARAVLRVGATEVGELAPFATAVIHGVPAGIYELGFLLPNGALRRTRTTAGEP